MRKMRSKKGAPVDEMGCGSWFERDEKAVSAAVIYFECIFTEFKSRIGDIDV